MRQESDLGSDREAKLDTSLEEQSVLREQLARHQGELDELRSLPEMMRTLVSGQAHGLPSPRTRPMMWVHARVCR